MGEVLSSVYKNWESLSFNCLAHQATLDSSILTVTQAVLVKPNNATRVWEGICNGEEIWQLWERGEEGKNNQNALYTGEIVKEWVQLIKTCNICLKETWTKEENSSSTAMLKIPEEIPNPIRAFRVLRRQPLAAVLTQRVSFSKHSFLDWPCQLGLSPITNSSLFKKSEKWISPLGTRRFGFFNLLMTF